MSEAIHQWNTFIERDRGSEARFEGLLACPPEFSPMGQRNPLYHQQVEQLDSIGNCRRQAWVYPRASGSDRKAFSLGLPTFQLLENFGNLEG
ncbi:hypothetical protein OF385_05190 [Glutamicibacter sp. JL.03c]|uniref:hypothetical protein n=1 Tax=Glutamicibacter sp. JL.03c TaxID=2984842 RepID=UPI0021F73A9E|nr:hypothetical protein [Glutamicibacter sp. JL.03c]UYQ78544.1 hypothetical protein OF385_05190 [Glutamicibacter sp. JL.03c]